MGQKDILEKLLENYNDVFADMVNGLLFGGRKLITEQQLCDLGTRSQYGSGDKLREQERDTLKVWNRRGRRLAVIGFENQTSIDEHMPLRTISYDGAAYRSQYNGNKTNACPVITLILNFSEKEWPKEKCLSDIVDVPEELQPYFNDYRISVFDVAYFTNEQIDMFTSDFRIIADYLVQARCDPENYVPVDQEIKHVDAVLKLMYVLTGDDRYTKYIDELGRKGEPVKMCKVLDIIEDRGRAEGIEKGRAEGRTEGMKQGGLVMLAHLAEDGTITVEKAAEKAGMSISDFRNVMDESL